MTWDQKLDVVGWGLFIVALFSFLSLISANQGKLTGWWLSILARSFGLGMYLVPILLGGIGLWLVLRQFGDRVPKPEPEQIVGVSLGFLVLLTTLHLIISWLRPTEDLYILGQEGLGGGMLGAALLDQSVQAIGRIGTIITLILWWIIVIVFSMGISPADAMRILAGLDLDEREEDGYDAPPVQTRLPSKTVSTTGPPPPRPAPKVLGGSEAKPARKTRARKKQSAGPAIHTSARTGKNNVPLEILPLESQVWRLPDVGDILERGSEQYFSEDLILKQRHIIEETLVSLGAPVGVREINNGPTVTQFGVEPLLINRAKTRCPNCNKNFNIEIIESIAETAYAVKLVKCTHCDHKFEVELDFRKNRVKVNSIKNLADDLALALSARSIRIQAPIPGKGLVGIEVPNEEFTIVSLLDVMQSDSFNNLTGRLRLGLGQDVSGQASIADLRRMPHLLIAGATGAGKSVCVNSIVAALLLQNSPETLRLLMVDPKRVELTQYNHIPHLLMPVIVDVEQVVPALRWVMREMDSRYRNFAKIGARNIEDYNKKVKNADDDKPIPYIVVLIDELADMMMQLPDETERVICRLAQMARATGIHLIIATQRPSVDVVTGLIKANFPARVAFAVASSIDSRVILDTPGAERLLGRGDMLFMPPDVGHPLRLQGAFVSDHELDRLIHFWRNAIDPDRMPERVHIPTGARSIAAMTAVTEAGKPLQTALPEFDDMAGSPQFEDALLPKAVRIFLSENRASTSLLQRRLRIGYTRAARLMDNLTDMGIVTLEAKGQFRGVNRAVAESLLQSLGNEENGGMG